MRFNLAKVPVGGGLLLGLSLGIVCVWLSHKFFPTQNYRQAYGQAIADLTARYSAEELFHQNLVAQQSLLSELVNYPQVNVAAIYDQQDKLLVQAGNKDYPRLPAATTFKAPIRLHDRVAGYVSVTLVDPLDTPAKIHMAMTWLGPLGLVTALWLIVRAGAIEIRMSGNNSGNYKDSKPKPEKVETFATEARLVRVFSAIEIKNSSLLKQQLSVAVYQSTLARLEEIAKRVLSVYNGTIDVSTQGRLVLEFEDSSETHEVALNAVCSTLLIIELAKTIDNIPLELAACIASAHDKLSPPEGLPVASVVLDREISNNATLKQHLQMSLLNNEWQILTDFAGPTKTLLEKQYRQLANLI